MSILRVLPRQHRFLENVARGVHPAEAAEMAGYRSTAARQTAHRLLRKPEMQGVLQKLCEQYRDLETIRKRALDEDNLDLALKTLELIR